MTTALLIVAASPSRTAVGPSLGTDQRNNSVIKSSLFLVANNMKVLNMQLPLTNYTSLVNVVFDIFLFGRGNESR